MDNLNQQGVYIIRNKITDYFYIGSSVNIYNRWRNHRFKITNGKHSSKKMIEDYNLYGIESFEIKILELVINSRDLVNREQYWMNYYNINQEKNYNVCKNAGTNQGRKLDEETKVKISEKLKGKVQYDMTDEIKEKMRLSKLGRDNFKKRKKVLQYDKSMNFIKEWDSVSEICEAFGWYANALRKACNGARKTYKGFIWKYKE